MAKQFEIIFEKSGAVLVAELLESEAPITCENFWDALAEPLRRELHHGGETGPEMWSATQERPALRKLHRLA